MPVVLAQNRLSPEADAPLAPTFARDVAPILFEHCVTCHHPEGSAPFSLLTYEEARSRARLIADLTRRRYMPPWKPEPGHGAFVGARRLSDDQIATFERWAAAGAPLGHGADLPLPPRFTNGWELGTPDLVVRMPEPFDLPPEGPDLYRTFVLRIPVETIRYVKAFEFKPGDSRAVHHATMLIDRTAASHQRDEEDPAPGYDGGFVPSADYPDGHFLGWAPGQRPPPMARGLSWALHPGSDLVMQLHLKPTGRREPVQAAVGLFFTTDAPTRSLTLLRLSRQDIDIPAGVVRHVVADSFVLPADVEIYAVQPHAHYRATEVKATATLPNGTLQSLISIPRWDFDWQDLYHYVEPLRLPRGTTVSMQFVFDNSAANPRNPELPPRRVRWGQSSRDEMAEVMLQLAPRSPGDLPLLERAFVQKHRRDVIAGYETRLSLAPEDAHLHDDVAQLYIDDGRTAVAIAHFQESVRLMPLSAPRQINLGKALAAAGRIEQAARAFEAAAQIDPRDVAALSNLGVLRTLQGRINEAVSYYRRALDVDSSYAEAHSNLSTALLYLGRTDEALEHAQRAIDLQPGLAAAHYNFARALLGRRQPHEAGRQFAEALRLHPDWPTALKDFAWMLATHPDPAVRSPGRAIDFAERAVQLAGREQPALLDVLAAAFAAAGRFDEAIATAERALSLVPTGDPDRVSAGIAARLAEYKRGKPYRETR
jgi:tetratricopeptide (TPR) repeat protein